MKLNKYINDEDKKKFTESELSRLENAVKKSTLVETEEHIPDVVFGAVNVASIGKESLDRYLNLLDKTPDFCNQKHIGFGAGTIATKAKDSLERLFTLIENTGGFSAKGMIGAAAGNLSIADIGKLDRYFTMVENMKNNDAKDWVSYGVTNLAANDDNIKFIGKYMDLTEKINDEESKSIIGFHVGELALRKNLHIEEYLELFSECIEPFNKLIENLDYDTKSNIVNNINITAKEKRYDFDLENYLNKMCLHKDMIKEISEHVKERHLKGRIVDMLSEIIVEGREDPKQFLDAVTINYTPWVVETALKIVRDTYNTNIEKFGYITGALKKLSLTKIYCLQNIENCTNIAEGLELAEKMDVFDKVFSEYNGDMDLKEVVQQL